MPARLARTEPPVNRHAIFSAPGEPRKSPYRTAQGGGVVGTTLTTRDVVSTAEADMRGRGFKLTLSPGGADYRLLKPVNGDPIRAVIPLAQFCKLANQGRIVVDTFDGPATNIIESEAVANPHEPPLTIDIGSAAGIRALFEEACPS
jgi:hypothetical protein